MAKLILLFVLITSAHAKDERYRMIEEFMKQRNKMMNDLMNDDSFFSGQGMFNDDLMDKFDNNSFGSNRFASNVTITQTKKDNGDIKVVITPKSKNIKLDIQTTDQLLTVTSKTLIEQEDDSDRGKSVIKSVSSLSQSIGIPFGYELGAPKTEGDSVVYIMTKTKGGKKPLKPIDMSDSI